MISPFDRRGAACLLNGWHPKNPPDNPDGGLRSGIYAFQWGSDAFILHQNPIRADDGTFFPGGSADRVKKIKSWDVGSMSTPSIRFFGVLSTTKTYYGMFWLGTYPWWFMNATDFQWINSRWPGQDLGLTTPYPSWPPNKQFIPTTKVEIIKGYGERYDANFNQIGWSRQILTSKIEGAPYNINSGATYWPTLEYGEYEDKPMEWSPTDEGFEEMDNNYGSDGPQYRWYFKDTGDDIGADKLNPVDGVGGGSGGVMWARDEADGAMYFDLPEDAIAVSDSYAYKPDKTPETGVYNWHRQDLKLDIYAVIVGASACDLKNKCWYEDATYTVKVTYMEGTAKMDRDIYIGNRDYPDFGGGSDNVWTQSCTLGEQSAPPFAMGGDWFKLATMEWNDLPPDTYRRIFDFSVSLD